MYWCITSVHKVTRYDVAEYRQRGGLGERRGGGTVEGVGEEERRGRRGEIAVSSRVQDRYLGIPETFVAHSVGVSAALSKTESPGRLCPSDTRADAMGLLIRAKTA